MSAIDTVEFFKRTSGAALRLVQYIFKVQGVELRRLDFNAVAAELGVGRSDLVREYKRLGELGIIITEDKKLRLDPKMIKKF